jgi:hypothetical protein
MTPSRVWSPLVTICLLTDCSGFRVRVRVRVMLRLTMSQSVCLGVEPRPGSWPDVCYSLTVTVLSLGGRPLWWEDGSVVCQSQSAVLRQLSLRTSIYILHVLHGYDIYTWPLSVRAQYSRLCPTSGSFRYNGSLVTWMVVLWLVQLASLYSLDMNQIENTVSMVSLLLCVYSPIPPLLCEYLLPQYRYCHVLALCVIIRRGLDSIYCTYTPNS